MQITEGVGWGGNHPKQEQFKEGKNKRSVYYIKECFGNVLVRTIKVQLKVKAQIIWKGLNTKPKSKLKDTKMSGNKLKLKLK